MAYDIGPKITLKGEAEFKKALNDINSELKEYGSELKTAATNAEGSSKSIDTLAKKYEVLQKQYDTQNKKLELYRQMLEKIKQKEAEQADALAKAKTQFGENSKEAERAERAYRSTKDEVSKLNVAINETENFCAKAKQQLQATADEAEELGNQYETASDKIAKAGSGLQTVGGAAVNAGKKLTATVTAPIMAAGGASVKMAMTFEDAMAKLSTIADTSEVPLEDLETQIKSLSNESGISSAEIAENVYNAISAGQKTGDTVNFVTESTKLAKAGFADAGQSLDLLTTILNAYGMEAGEVTKVSDMLVETQNLGKTTVGELSSAMGKVIPTANATNTSLDQLCAGYAIMTANGVATAETTTYMNSMLNELGKTGSTTDKVLREKTGKSFSELMASGSSLGDVLAVIDESAKADGKSLSDMFSSAEAGKAGLILLGDSAEDFNGTLKQMQDSAGATGTAFAKVMGTNSAKASKSFEQLRNVAIDLGSTLLDMLAPVIEKIAGAIESFSNWFSSLDDGMKNTIITIAGLVAAVGPVIIVIGKLLEGLGSIMTWGPKLFSGIGKLKGLLSGLFTFLQANPVIAIVSGIIAAVTLLYNNCEWFRDGVNEIFGALWQWLQDVFGKLAEWFQTTIPAVLDWFSQKWGEIWQSVKENFAPIWEFLSGIFEGFKKLFNGDLPGAINQFKTSWAKAWENVKTNFLTIWNAIKSPFENLWQTACKWGKDLLDGFIGGIKQKWSDFTGWVGNIAGNIADFLHFSVPDKGPLSDFDESGGDMIDLLIKGMKSKQSALRSAVNQVADTMALASGAMTGNFAMSASGELTVNMPVILDGKTIQKSVNRVTIDNANAASIARGGV